MPRSGTTLTEQLLAAHPGVHGCGELPDLFLIGNRFARPGSRTIFFKSFFHFFIHCILNNTVYSQYRTISVPGRYRFFSVS